MRLSQKPRFWRLHFVAFWSLACVLMSGSIAQAAIVDGFFDIGFERITFNNTENLSSQLGLTVYDDTFATDPYGVAIGPDQALFVFENLVGITANVAEIYVDDGTIVGLDRVINSQDLTGASGFTDFVPGGPDSNDPPKPPNLPGGENLVPPFVATKVYSADTAPGPPGNGLNAAAERVAILYDLVNSVTLQDVSDAFDSGELRVGLHIRTIGALGGSDSYVTSPDGGITINEIPEPASLLVWGGVLCCAVGFGYRRRFAKR